MPAEKKKIKRRRKYCPVCKEELSMSVMREAEDENDLWWLLCTECESKFALTHQEYQKEKRPGMSAIEKEDARVYHTDQTYSVGEVIYHQKLDDVGLVVSKTGAPSSVDCSSSVIVSFMEIGQKTLIEGYAVA